MRTIRTVLLVLSAATAAVPAAFGDSATANIGVSVQVVARTILTIDREPAALEITRQDIARGYVDVPAAVAFRVRSNASNGYRVEFEPLGYPFTRAEIAWDGQLARVSADGSWLTRSYERGERTGALNVHLALAPDASPGAYPWPVHFDASSL